MKSKGGEATYQKVDTVFEQLNTRFREDLIKRRNHIASNAKFNAIIVLLVFVNTVIIGLEVDNARGQSVEDRPVYFACELFFAIVFFVEMLLRVHQLGWDYFLDPWNMFDYSLVGLSFSEIVSSMTQPESGGMGLAKNLRVFRLFRVVRSIKGVKIISGLWLIIQGLLESMLTVFWVLCAALIFTFMCAVVLTTIVGHDLAMRRSWHAADIYIGSVLKSMMTVLQVYTFDSWGDEVARPLLHCSPYSLPILLLSIIILAFGVLNIVVAVMVERIHTIMTDSLETSAKVLKDTESALTQSILEDLSMFCIEHDLGGELSLKAFKKVIRRPALTQKLNLMGIRFDEAESLFDLMDVDKSGAVTPQEFTDGIMKVKGFAKGHDVVRLICKTNAQCSRASQSVDRLRHLNEIVDEIQERLNLIGRECQLELGFRQDSQVRADDTWQKAAKRQLVIHKFDRHRKNYYPGLIARKARAYDGGDDF